MPVYYTTNGDEFEVKLNDRSYGGRTTTKFKVDKSGNVLGPTNKSVLTGTLYSAVAVGANNSGEGDEGAGHAKVTAAKVGDKVIACCNLTDTSDVQAKFETVVTVDGEVQQSSGTDNYSAKNILFILQSP